MMNELEQKARERAAEIVRDNFVEGERGVGDTVYKAYLEALQLKQADYDDLCHKWAIASLQKEVDALRGADDQMTIAYLRAITEVEALQEQNDKAGEVIQKYGLKNKQLQERCERLESTLKKLRLNHYECQDGWYSCPKSEGGCLNDGEGDDCTCGADKHNQIIDQALTETKGGGEL